MISPVRDLLPKYTACNDLHSADLQRVVSIPKATAQPAQIATHDENKRGGDGGTGAGMGRDWGGLKGSVEVSSPVALAIEYGQCVHARHQAQIVVVYRL